MTERERLVELLKTMIHSSKEMTFDDMADYLLDNGIIVPPCKFGDDTMQN